MQTQPTNFKIVTPTLFDKEDIDFISKQKNARYIIDSCLKTKDGSYANQPAAFFYANEKHPQGSNFFALFWTDIGLMITDGIQITEQDIVGLMDESGEIIHSRYRHDFVQSSKGYAIDGGRDYVKISGSGFKPVKIKVSLEGDLIIEQTRITK